MGGARGRMLFGVAALLGCVGVGCDDLSVPPAPDAGGTTPTPTSTTGSTELPLPSYAPAGAVRGEVKDILNSRLATWVTLDGDKKVATIGWNMPLSMVAALEGSSADSRLFMHLPAEAARDTAVVSMSHGFMAHGHTPNGVYDTPHFDYHLGFVTIEDFKAVDCTDPTLPSQKIIPQGWGIIPPPDNCVGLMGIHGINFAAPEFNGQRFTITAVNLYYRGKTQANAGQGAIPYGWDPKMTVQSIKERKTFSLDVPVMPAGSFGRATKQPTKMVQTYIADQDTYVVEFNTFVDVN